jgi:ribosomal protein L2
MTRTAPPSSRWSSTQDGELAYILAPQRLAVGDSVIAGAKVDVKPGNAMPFAACRSARSSTTSS